MYFVFIDGPRDVLIIVEKGGAFYEGIDGGQSIGSSGEDSGRGQRHRPSKTRRHPRIDVTWPSVYSKV